MGKIYQNENQILVQELIVIYQPNGFDWLSYQITKGNMLTLHHVTKVADGGVLCIDNAALLTKRSHRILNICEVKDFNLYTEINDFFREIIVLRSPLNYYMINQSKEYKKALTNVVYGQKSA